MNKAGIKLCLFLLGAASALAQPSITSVSVPAAARSDRVLLLGSGFGASQRGGRVEIAGRRAPLTRWSNTLIAAYVPEAAPVGTTTVQVIGADGSVSNTVPLTVTLRATPTGQVRWRFTADGDYIQSRPAVASDGTVYAIDVSGHLYALTPDGALKWVFNATGSGFGNVSVGLDGTIYTGSTSAIFALRPDGTLLWKFDQQPSAFILLGPNVGPDGNIYAVATQGIGVFSLSPQGSLRWSVPENYDRPIVILQDIAFGSGALYFNANNHKRGIRFDGTPVFTIAGSIGASQGDAQPAVAPNGNIYINTFSALGQGLALSAFDPGGSLLWTALDQSTNVLGSPDAGPDSVVYDARNLSTLYALNPDGSTRWQYVDGGIILTNMVSPLNDLLFLGGVVTYGQPGFFEAVSTSGQSLWKETLPVENGLNVVPMSRTRFSADGQTAYIGTSIPGQTQNIHSYLYSVQTGSTAVVLTSVTLNPAKVRGGNPSVGTVTLSAPAPEPGVKVKLHSNNTAVATVPPSVTVPTGSTSANFTVTTLKVVVRTKVRIAATYAGVKKVAVLVVTP